MASLRDTVREYQDDLGTVKYYAQIHLQFWRELSLHRAGKPAHNYLVAEDRDSASGAAKPWRELCFLLSTNFVFCISMCFMLMYFFRPIGFRRHDAVWRIPASKPNGHQGKVPTTRVLRRISRFRRSMTLLVRIFLPVLRAGKSIYVNVSSMATFSYSPPQFRFR